MKTADENLTTGESEATKKDTSKESQLPPPEEKVREFEEYLLDIGVRI